MIIAKPTLLLVREIYLKTFSLNDLTISVLILPLITFAKIAPYSFVDSNRSNVFLLVPSLLGIEDAVVFDESAILDTWFGGIGGIWFVV
jgi:hypothetical protein